MVQGHPNKMVDLHQELKIHPVIKDILKSCASWPGEQPLKRHNDAKQLYHKLNLLADLGFKATDKALKPVVAKIFSTQHQDGPFQINILIPNVFGGSGKPEKGWTLCDTPLVLNALLALGVKERTPQIKKALVHLLGLISPHGFPCASHIPKFKGPGRKTDPCPYATLLSLRALSHSNTYKNCDAVKIGTETLLSHWEQQKEIKMRMFGIGTDFKKLKYPFIWYDILHVLEVLSSFPQTHKDKRLKEMLNIVTSKADKDGFYTPESVWLAYKGLDFSQKKVPSPILTCMVRRIINRVDNVVS